MKYRIAEYKDHFEVEEEITKTKGCLWWKREFKEWESVIFCSTDTVPNFCRVKFETELEALEWIESQFKGKDYPKHGIIISNPLKIPLIREELEAFGIESKLGKKYEQTLQEEREKENNYLRKDEIHKIIKELHTAILYESKRVRDWHKEENQNLKQRISLLENIISKKQKQKTQKN